MRENIKWNRNILKNKHPNCIFCEQHTHTKGEKKQVTSEHNILTLDSQPPNKEL